MVFFFFFSQEKKDQSRVTHSRLWCSNLKVWAWYHRERNGGWTLLPGGTLIINGNIKWNVVVLMVFFGTRVSHSRSAWVWLQNGRKARRPGLGVTNK